MKRITISLQPLIMILAFLSLCYSTHSQVGIGTVTPTEALDVSGNVKFTGALMPGNLAGNANQLLLSAGAGATPTWGLELLNTSQTTQMGKFFVNGLSLGAGLNIISVTDTNCVLTSTCMITWVDLPAVSSPPPTTIDYSLLTTTVVARNGSWDFYIRNNTGFTFTGFSFSFFAAY